MQLSEIDILKIEETVKAKYVANNKMSRFNHILGVKKMALYLCDKYHCDKTKAAVAALIHDYYKYEDFEEMKKVIRKEDIEECEKYPFLYHAYASAESLKKEFNIDDVEIYNAIRHHVFGTNNMTLLEKIIMISDYTEEGRTQDKCIKTREILLNEGIDKAIYHSLLNTILYVKQQGLEPHPMELKILKEYEVYNGTIKNNN